MEDRKYFDPEIETMDRSQLEELQMDRLRWQLKRCYDLSPFYQERFKKAGIKPEDIRSLEEIVHIPPVTKGELREEQLAHPPFGPLEGIRLPPERTGPSFTPRREPRESPSIPYGLAEMSKPSPPGPLGQCGTSACDRTISFKMPLATGCG